MSTEHNKKDEHIYDELYIASIHAVNLLGLLQSIESIPHILNRLKNEAEDSDYFLDSIEFYVKNMGVEGLNSFEKYIFDNPKKFEVNYILDGLLHLAQSDETCKDRVVEIFIKYIKNDTTDPEVLSSAICHLIELTEDEYIELIRETFATKEVDEFMCGNLKEIEIELGLRDSSDGSIDGYTFVKDTKITKPIIRDKKIGRNEPCPCGSGKKYKKCCMNKEA